MILRRLPEDLRLHLTLAFLAGQPGPMATQTLADALWWMDRLMWAEMAEGLRAEEWVVTADGVDLPSLERLRAGDVPEAWKSWLHLTAGQVMSAVSATEDELDELSPRMWDIVAETADLPPERWARDRRTPAQTPAQAVVGQPLSVADTLAWCGHPLAGDPDLVADATERLGLRRVMARYT